MSGEPDGECCTMTGGQPLRVSAAMPCGFAGCGQIAAMVELIPKGAAYADGQKDILHEIDPSCEGTFRLSGFLPYTGYSTVVGDYQAVVAAVRGAGDSGPGGPESSPSPQRRFGRVGRSRRRRWRHRTAAVLYELNKEYAPFFCAECGVSYCGTHWKLKPVFDRGFDYYTGNCPVGHKKFIDH